MKKPDGVIVIAVYYALVALVFLLGSCALLFAMVSVLSNVFEPTAVMWSGFGIGIGLLFCLLFLVGSILAAWGLLALKNWGRWAAIILGILQLPAFPIWTVIGGLIIYYLLRDDVKAAFNGHGPFTAAMTPAPPLPEPFAAPAMPEVVPPAAEPAVEPVPEPAPQVGTEEKPSLPPEA